MQCKKLLYLVWLFKTVTTGIKYVSYAILTNKFVGLTITYEMARSHDLNSKKLAIIGAT